jgi:hypothetical protein
MYSSRRYATPLMSNSLDMYISLCVLGVCKSLYVYSISSSLKNSSYPLGSFRIAKGVVDILQ